MADYEKYISTYQFSLNVFILYIRHISAPNNFFFPCNILSLLVLHGRSIWFFSVKCFCIVFHVWTCQLTTENLVMMNKVSYFQSSPLLSFLSNQDSAGETAYFTSLHQYRALFPQGLTFSCQLCPTLKRDVKPFWNWRHDSKEKKKPETASAVIITNHSWMNAWRYLTPIWLHQLFKH